MDFLLSNNKLLHIREKDTVISNSVLEKSFMITQKGSHLLELSM